MIYFPKFKFDSGEACQIESFEFNMTTFDQINMTTFYLTKFNTTTFNMTTF